MRNPLATQGDQRLAAWQVPRVRVAGHEFELFTESSSLIASMVSDIQTARARVWMETYIFLADAAGKAAAKRSLPLLFEEGFSAKILLLPEKDDPDSYLRRQGGAAFDKMLSQARSVIDFIFAVSGKDKTETVRETLGIISAAGFLPIAILAGMILSVGYSGYAYLRGDDDEKESPAPAWREFAIPVLAILGLGVAGYLAYIETQAVQAVCGPVGDCNAVQSSRYAKLFGVLTIGIVGLGGYILILGAWIGGRMKAGRFKGTASLAIFAMAFLGTLFSLYLTYLEPFVIRAVCIWCLSSAVIITLVLVLSVKPALHLSSKWSAKE